MTPQPPEKISAERSTSDTLPSGSAVPLEWSTDNETFSNITAFVQSMFTTGARDTDAMRAAMQAGDLFYPFCDLNSREMILQCWMDAWAACVENPTAPVRPSQCPSTDFYLIQFLVSYISNFYQTWGVPLCLCVPDLAYVPGSADGGAKPKYLNRGYGRLPFMRGEAWCMGALTGGGYPEDPDHDGGAVARFLFLLFHGAHMPVIDADGDTRFSSTSSDFRMSFYNQFNGSSLPNVGVRRDPGNSHYAGVLNVTSYYYLSITSTAEPSYEPLLCAFLVGDTAASPSNQNSFLQLEGWQAITGDNAWHMGDYDASIASYWNFSTYGCCAFAEKRSTACFIAPPDFNLEIDVQTRMPAFGGADTQQDWMAYKYALTQPPAVQGALQWGELCTGPGGGGATIGVCSRGAVALWSSSGNLFYRMGTFVTDGVRVTGITWHGTGGTQYDSGISVAMAMSESGIVEVHNATAGNNLYWNVGIPNWSTMSIQWNPHGTNYDDGYLPSIAMDSAGNLLEMHTSSAGGGGKAWYNVGSVSFGAAQGHQVSFGSAARVHNTNGDRLEVNQSALAWCGGSTVLAVLEDVTSLTLTAMLGVASTGGSSGGSVAWGMPFPYSQRGSCVRPNLTRLSSGQIVGVHQIKTDLSSTSEEHPAYSQALVMGLPVTGGQGGLDRTLWSHTGFVPAFTTGLASVASLNQQVFVSSGAQVMIGTLDAPSIPRSTVTINTAEQDLLVVALLQDIPWVFCRQGASMAWLGGDVIPGQLGRFQQLAVCSSTEPIQLIGLSTNGSVQVAATWQGDAWGLGGAPFNTSDQRYQNVYTAVDEAGCVNVFGHTPGQPVYLIARQAAAGSSTWTVSNSALPQTAPNGGATEILVASYTASGGVGQTICVIGMDRGGYPYLITQRYQGAWHAPTYVTPLGQLAFGSACAVVGAQHQLFLLGVEARSQHVSCFAVFTGTTPNTTLVSLDGTQTYTSISAGMGNGGRVQVLGVTLSGAIRLAAWLSPDGQAWQPGGTIATVPGVTFAGVLAATGGGHSQQNLQVLGFDTGGRLYLASWQDASSGHWTAGCLLG